MPPVGFLLEVRLNYSGESLDEIDLAIFREFRHDGRESFREVARQLGVSEGTVRGRTRRLQDLGIFRFQSVMNPSAVGLNCIAYVGLTVRTTNISLVVENLLNIEEFAYVSVALGRFNVVCMVFAETREALGELLIHKVHTIAGVIRAETMEVLKIFKFEQGFV